MLLKILPFALYTSSVSPGFAKQIMLILRILRYNGSLVTSTVVSLTAAKFKPLVFSMSGFASRTYRVEGNVLNSSSIPC
jgi:hypothetical protein